MIEFDKFTLNNGLRVIVHQDKSTPLVAVNTLYDVGARDESEERTGFAHLFEHLMFGGSVNIPEFDTPLQMAGGENNAFTSNDITNYYDTLPASNIETALWLESDRMLSLAFTEKSLEVQRSVVIEEFKQRYINQPYGDLWHVLRKEAYKEHPYKWPTIGKDLSHIEDATMEDVKSFFFKHYGPQNAILCVAGNCELNQVQDLVSKWYDDIPTREKYIRNIQPEPLQTELREIEHSAKVPTNALFMAFKMCGRYDNDYPVYDLTSDILSRGSSSRLMQNLVKEKGLFSNISAYVLGAYDDGLFVVSGYLNKGVEYMDAEKAVWEELERIQSDLSESELEKVKNKFESAVLYGNVNVLNRAMNLCFYELHGDAGLVNHELAKYRSVKSSHVKALVAEKLVENRCTILRYRANDN